MLPPRFWIQSKNWLQIMFNIMVRIKCLCFWKGVENVKAERALCNCDYHLLIWIICFSISGVLCFPATRQFCDLLRSKIIIHQESKDNANLNTKSGIQFSAVHSWFVPSQPMKMFPDKAYRVCQSFMNHGCQNTRLFRQVSHWSNDCSSSVAIIAWLITSGPPILCHRPCS
jgi:hypothetical protein